MRSAKIEDLLDDLSVVLGRSSRGSAGRHQRISSSFGSGRRPDGGGGGGGRISGGVGALTRAASKSPEVVLKVTKGVSGAKHLLSHMEYITRNSKLIAENELGLTIEGRKELLSEWEAWTLDFAKASERRRDSVNMIFSMAPGTPREAVLDSVRALATRNFGANWPYIMVLHNDTDHPHVHLTCKALGRDGTKLRLNKQDLQALREDFAKELRGRGIHCEATPRRARGVHQKSEKQVVRHLRERGAATIDANPRPSPMYRPWEERIAANRRHIPELYERVARALDASGNFYDRQNAKAIRNLADKVRLGGKSQQQNRGRDVER